jgi:hypothetical protein
MVARERYGKARRFVGWEGFLYRKRKMIITDYTIEWTDTDTATLSWEGGATAYYYSIYIDGIFQFRMVGSGSIEKSISLNSESSHIVSIVRHDAAGDDVQPPESTRLLRPSVRWGIVENASKYAVYQVEGDDEYIMYEEIVETDSEKTAFSWEFPVELTDEGLANVFVKVYAFGSFGVCDVPFSIVGFACGFPEYASDFTVAEDSSGELVLEINT